MIVFLLCVIVVAIVWPQAIRALLAIALGVFALLLFLAGCWWAYVAIQQDDNYIPALIVVAVCYWMGRWGEAKDA